MRLRRAPAVAQEPDMHQMANSRWHKIRKETGCSKSEAKSRAGVGRSPRHGRPVGR